jgi:hypothetical protein
MSTAKKHPAGEGGSVLHAIRKSAAGAWRFLTESGLSFFPLRQTLRGYNRIRFRSDAHAALNVALMGFPQGMAYALIAGLPVEFGIFASAVTCIVAPFFLSCRFTIVGPTNATAVMVFGALSIMGESDNKYWMAACLVFLVGIFLILAAVCRVASLTQYISASVVTGYVTAAALLIIANQIHYAFGFEVDNTGVLWHVIYETFMRLPQTHGPTLVLSLATLVIAGASARYLKAVPNVAVNLVAGALMAWAMGRYWGWNVETLNAVHASSWKFSFPDPHPFRRLGHHGHGHRLPDHPRKHIGREIPGPAFRGTGRCQPGIARAGGRQPRLRLFVRHAQFRLSRPLHPELGKRRQHPGGQHPQRPALRGRGFCHRAVHCPRSQGLPGGFGPGRGLEPDQ